MLANKIWQQCDISTSHNINNKKAQTNKLAPESQILQFQMFLSQEVYCHMHS